MSYYRDFTLEVPQAFYKLWEGQELTFEALPPQGAKYMNSIAVFDEGRHIGQLDVRRFNLIDYEGGFFYETEPKVFECRRLNASNIPGIIETVSAEVEGLFFLQEIGEDGRIRGYYSKDGNSYMVKGSYSFPPFNEDFLGQDS